MTAVEQQPTPVPAWPIDRCSSCNAEIIWAFTERNKAIPVDAQPLAAAYGNIELLPREGLAPLARVLPVAKRFGKPRLYVAHFTSCPNADRHRRGKHRRPG